jgi:cytochrome c-type biogenesis protein CcmH/NrfF
MGSPNQWDVFVYWVYGAAVLLLGGYAWYLIRLNRRLREDHTLEEERP